MAKPSWMGNSFKKASPMARPGEKLRAFADGGEVRANPADGGIVADAIRKRRSRLDAAIDGEEAPKPTPPRDVKKTEAPKGDLDLWGRAKRALGFADGGRIDLSDPMYADNSAGAHGYWGARNQEKVRDNDARDEINRVTSETVGKYDDSADLTDSFKSPEPAKEKEADFGPPVVDYTPPPKAAPKPKRAAPKPKRAAPKQVDYGDESARMAARHKPKPKYDDVPTRTQDLKAPEKKAAKPSKLTPMNRRILLGPLTAIEDVTGKKVVKD